MSLTAETSEPDMYTIEDNSIAAAAQLSVITRNFAILSQSNGAVGFGESEGQHWVKPAVSHREVNLTDLPSGFGVLPGPESVSAMFWISLNQAGARILADSNLYSLREAFDPVNKHVDVLVYLHRSVPIPPQPQHFSTGRIIYHFIRHEVAELEREIFLTPKNFIPSLNHDRQEFLGAVVSRITLLK